MRRRLVPAGRQALRGFAIFLAGFTMIGLIGELRGRTTDVSLWWIDLRDLPVAIRIGLLLALSVLLALWAVRVAPGPHLRRATAIACCVFAVLALRDAARFAGLAGEGLIRTSSPLPLSLLVVLAFAILAVAAFRAPAVDPGPSRRAWLPIGAAVIAWGLLFPLAEMYFFGTTDYRRPADAAIVFGARVYASGDPSPLLADRIRTGVELYRDGLVSTLVMSGGDGADGFNEAAVMRDKAVASGVDPAAILVDPAGITTEATVANTTALLTSHAGGVAPTRLIAVSQAYHLPRIQLAFATVGIDVLTVPAVDPQPIGEMPFLVAREVPAFWLYYLRVCLG